MSGLLTHGRGTMGAMQSAIRAILILGKTNVQYVEGPGDLVSSKLVSVFVNEPHVTCPQSVSGMS